jgi:hypothetical protein
MRGKKGEVKLMWTQIGIWLRALTDLMERITEVRIPVVVLYGVGEISRTSESIAWHPADTLGIRHRHLRRTLARI